jgi:hypothetical protein
MAENGDDLGKKLLAENFKPVNDPTLRNYKPGSGPIADPMVSPDIKPGPAIGVKPGEGAGPKPGAGGGGAAPDPKGGGQAGEQST